MELTTETKNLIAEAKNICLIPSQSHEPESLSATLALFYTLKELNKNVNLIVEDFPEKFNFLIPSLDYISTPKNFVIAIPKSVAEVSQVYYEKSEENVKIHLTIERGSVKKDNISFYFSEAKPDLVITVGVPDFQKTLEGKLDSFGFLLEAPILNIDNHSENKRFGKENIIEETSLAQIMLDITKSLGLITQTQTPMTSTQNENSGQISKNTATCLLTGLTVYYENFQKPNTSAQIFELCAQLMRQGADRQQILAQLYSNNDQEPYLQEQNIETPPTPSFSHYES